jgi:N6-adenosine-specific RNA methylase IME4
VRTRVAGVRTIAQGYRPEPVGLLVADPPWAFADQLPGAGRGAAKNYGVLALEQIKGFPLPPLAPDCALLLWRVSSMVEEAYAVCRAWGFAPKSELVWRKMRRCGACKGSGRRNSRLLPRSPDAWRDCEACGGRGERPHFGMGRSVRNCHEVAIIGHRGRPQRLDGSVRSTFDALMPTDERGKLIHSAKPPEFFRIAERLYGGPRAELFSRTDREGWSCYGNQAGKYGRVA